MTPTGMILGKNAFRTLLLLLSSTHAQTYTDCNPTTSTSCPSDTGLSSSSYSVDFTHGASNDWEITAGSVNYNSNGASFTVSQSGDAPTLASNFYLFFGRISFILQAAPGTGIVSSAILESADLDEIDWEWLGGSATSVETNYFGKGNTSTYDRATYVTVPDTQVSMRNYTIVWTAAATRWYVDGTLVRTLGYADALAGKNYPQTPMRIRVGIWAGGDSKNSEGTIEWAGGETDYANGPFTMVLKAVEVENYNPAVTYTYSDMTGDWTSIKLGAGNSGASEGNTTSGSSSKSGTNVSSAASASKTTAAKAQTSSSTPSSSSYSSSAVSTSSAAKAGFRAWRVGTGWPLVAWLPLALGVLYCSLY